MRREEKWVLGVFLSVAAGWVLRGLVPLPWLQGLDDSTIAMAGALALFLIPASEEHRGYLLDWASAVRIPWDVILLFGGGFALARGFEASGLADWIGQQLRLFEGAPVLAIIAAVTLLTIFLTEVTSNTATASMLLPIVAALSSAAAVHPYGPMAAAALAASFAFMLPVATPPNAIVYGSRLVSIPQMARAGFWLNLVGAALITGAAGWLVPLVWDLDAAP
jgi:sodium-dependent dicarboxylate transporter 2/3/5